MIPPEERLVAEVADCEKVNLRKQFEKSSKKPFFMPPKFKSSISPQVSSLIRADLITLIQHIGTIVSEGEQHEVFELDEDGKGETKIPAQQIYPKVVFKNQISQNAFTICFVN